MKGVRRTYIVEHVETHEKKEILTLHAVADYLGRPYSTVQNHYRKNLSIGNHWIYLPEDADVPRELTRHDHPRNFDKKKRRKNESAMKFLARVSITMSTKAIAEELNVKTSEVERMYDWLLRYKRLGGKNGDLNMVRQAADEVSVLSKLQNRKALEGRRKRSQQMGE